VKKERAKRHAAAAGAAQPPLLVFVHIPKTAGTVLGSVLTMNEPGERTRRLSNVFKGSGGLSTTLIHRLRADAEPLNLDAARIVTGHFPLGIGEYLRKHAGPGRELRFITCLREPVDRTLSHYYQIRGRPPGPGKYTLSPLPSEPTLGDMLERGFTHDNVQTRMLSGLLEPFGEVTDDMLEQAKRNLRESLVFFGLTEQFDESLVLAKQRLGLSVLLSELEGNRHARSLSRSGGRVNTSRPRGEDVPQGLRQEAERCNRYDIELYCYAQKLFEAAPERKEIEFDVELAALQAARTEGEIEVAAPAPGGFKGSREEWRMLVTARATLLRHEAEFADIRVLTDDLRQRFRSTLALLARIKEAQVALVEQYESALQREREARSKLAVRAKEAKHLRGSEPKPATDGQRGARHGKRREPASPMARADSE
jgi:hypothetical protein